MIALYITGGLILIILLLLIIHVSADMRYRDKFFISVKYGGIKVFDSKKQKKPKIQKEKLQH